MRLSVLPETHRRIAPGLFTLASRLLRRLDLNLVGGMLSVWFWAFLFSSVCIDLQPVAVEPPPVEPGLVVVAPSRVQLRPAPDQQAPEILTNDTVIGCVAKLKVKL